MRRRRMADAFCCAGGGSMGYHRAGFDVVGVDIRPMPRYPFTFVQADAIEFMDSLLAGDGRFGYRLEDFDAFHGSPPCQDHMQSPMRGQQEHGTGWMLAATRERFQATGKPWVIENVPGAPMRADLVLCGCMFGLDVERKRWFETEPPLFGLMPPCYHGRPVLNTMRTRHGPWFREHGRVPTRAEIAEAMGIGWMRGEEIKQAIPPAYTEFIGEQLRVHLDHAKGPGHNALQGDRL